MTAFDPLHQIEGYTEAFLFSFMNGNYMKRLFGYKSQSIINKPFSESYYRDLLAIELNAKTEVKTPAGIIDVLSDNQIIEVKKINNWKGALGQVLSYSVFYPKHNKAIHLYGDAKTSAEVIVSTCLAFGVEVTIVPAEMGDSTLNSDNTPLSREELLQFSRNIYEAWDNSKSYNEAKFYCNLFHKVHEELLDNCSEQELVEYREFLEAQLKVLAA